MHDSKCAERFVVGSWYENSGFEFEVLAIAGDKLHVRTKAGKKKILSLSQQARFVKTRQKDAEDALTNGSW